MVFQVDGYRALASGSQSRRQADGRLIFHVSDITTFISSTLVIIRIFVNIWTSITLWRCAFALFENGGLDLSQFSWMMSWGLPPLAAPWERQGNEVRKTKERGVRWAVAVVLLFVFPQQFIAPLLSGSVDWEIGSENGTPVAVASGVEGARASDWYWYQQQIVTRQQHIYLAAGFAGTAWTNIEGIQDGVSSQGRRTCRHLMPNRPLPINSTLHDATIPCIEIHDITWPDHILSNDSRAYSYIKYEYGMELSRVEDKLFSYYHSGTAALFDPQRSASPPKFDTSTPPYFPNATLFNGTLTLFLFVDRQSPNGCSPILPNDHPSVFGDDTNRLNNNIFSYPSGGGNEICFAHATVTFTAGVVKAPISRYISSGVVQVDTNSSHDSPPAPPMEPSIWVGEALNLMPDVMVRIALMNASSMPTWNNLDNYTAALVSFAYLASWDMLHASFEENDTAVLTAIPAELRQQAVVSSVRVFAWLGVSLLLTLSGIFIGQIQARGCKRGTIVDFPAAVLLTDARKVIDGANRVDGNVQGTNKYTELTKMSYVTGQDSKIGAICLERTQGDGSGFELTLSCPKEGARYPRA